MHFDMAKPGHLYYLNINTTYNSSIMLNYNQKECAFWSNYLPSVIGMLVPTYPPTTEVMKYELYINQKNKPAFLLAVLVGAKRAPPDRLLERFRNVSATDSYCVHLLHAVEERSQVTISGLKKSALPNLGFLILSTGDAE